MSKLLEQLRALPQFNSFEKAVKEKLTIENFYVEHFAPEKGGVAYDKYDNRYYNYTLSNDEVKEQGIDGLISDNGEYFDEFVHSELAPEVTELVRVLIEEIRK